MANGYHITVIATEDGLVTRSERMDCSGLVINGFAVGNGTVRMTVAAEPETWLSGFFEEVRVRAGETLASTDGDNALLQAGEVSITLNDDGTVTIVAPCTASPTGFFKVEWPSP